MRLKARGERGSWFAEVEGERLPCVHMHWFQFRTATYDDPWLRPGEAKADELFEALKTTRRAIFTDDKVIGTKAPSRLDDGTIDKGERPLFERTGYRMLYEVAEVVFDQNGLRFKCTNKLAELK